MTFPVLTIADRQVNVLLASLSGETSDGHAGLICLDRLVKILVVSLSGEADESIAGLEVK